MFPVSREPRRMAVVATALATAALVGSTIAVAAQDDVTVTFRTRPDNDAEAQVYAQVADQISEQLDGITVEYQVGGSETSSYQDQLLTEAASGTAPDVFWIPGTDVARFGTNGIIADLREFADASGHSDDAFYPGPMFHLTYDPATGEAGGPLWGLPRDVSTFALYLNNDLIAEAGAEDPRELAANGEWTWEKFIEVGEAVAALGPDVKAYGQSNWWGPYGVWMNGAGGGFFNEDRTACALDTPESIAGLQQLVDIYGLDNFALSYGEDAEPGFQAGTIAMFQNGRWATPGMRANANFDWDVVALPEGPVPGGNWLFWGAYAANAESENLEAAWRVIEALTQPEVQATIAELGANIPSRLGEQTEEDFLTFTPPANNQAFLDGLANDPVAEGPLWDGSWPAFDTVMGAAVAGVINGEISIDEYQATVCAEADAAAFSE
ncbi:MAG: sugar ABC transporter substrate-binding protein [Candidatus Limnocylindrales bacterium]